jgi:hypothetical protein
MFNRSRAWAIALLGAVFVAGAATGWSLEDWRDSQRRAARRGPDGMVNYLNDKLDLTPVQRDSVRAIFQRHRPEMEALWREVHPRFDSVRAVVRREITAQLDATQQPKYARLIAEAEHQHQAGDSAKTQPPGGRH